MRLVVDANILVGELLRDRGRTLIADPRTELFIAAQAWGEAQYELRKRAILYAERRGSKNLEGLLGIAFEIAETHITVVGFDEYAKHETEARGRIPRDPDDWSTVALALTLSADIWTLDGDFLGCGVATWTSETLITKLVTN